MKNHYSVIILLAFLLLGPIASASITTVSISDPGSIKNTLILKKNNSSKSVEIPAGAEIKLWYDNYQTIKGTFLSVQNAQILLKTNDAEESIAINQIKRVKIIGPKPKLGQFFLTVGIAALVLGGISLIAGLAALGSESIGAVILVAVPLLGGAGLGLHKIGTKLSGKTFNLTKKWRIDN